MRPPCGAPLTFPAIQQIMLAVPLEDREEVVRRKYGGAIVQYIDALSSTKPYDTPIDRALNRECGRSLRMFITKHGFGNTAVSGCRSFMAYSSGTYGLTLPQGMTETLIWDALPS